MQGGVSQRGGISEVGVSQMQGGVSQRGGRLGNPGSRDAPAAHVQRVLLMTMMAANFQWHARHPFCQWCRGHSN